MVDYNGLENRRTERYRGFESLSLRKSLLKEISEGFFFYPPSWLFIIKKQKLKFTEKKIPKNLVESKNSRTFAPA